eukprot:386451-Prorocentrum_minimum.AAC.1
MASCRVRNSPECPANSPECPASSHLKRGGGHGLLQRERGQHVAGGVVVEQAAREADVDRRLHLVAGEHPQADVRLGERRDGARHALLKLVLDGGGPQQHQVPARRWTLEGSEKTLEGSENTIEGSEKTLEGSVDARGVREDARGSRERWPPAAPGPCAAIAARGVSSR